MAEQPINALPPTAGILVLVAVLIGLAGILSMSEAAAGPTIVGFACVLGIWARVAQAAGHHRDLMKRHDSLKL